nr:hypothetical protein [Tanacetum cinerariifolium]GEZ53145.1 hypothetical protein [Tanacetum cinerariifolium]
MDLLSFIRTTDLTNVRIGEKEHDEDEPKLLETTVKRVVPLLMVAPDCSSGELETSVDKLFDEGGRGEQADQGDSTSGGHGKTKVVDAGEPSHPAKKLRGDYGVSVEPTVGEREGGDHTALLAGANLHTLEAPQRFIISSDSSDHLGVNIAEDEVDSFFKTYVPIMTRATTATPTADLAATANERLVGSLVFGSDSSSASGSHPISGGFSDRTGSDFLVSGEKEVEVRGGEEGCVAKYNEIESLKAQLIVKEAEAAEVFRLRDEAKALKDRNTNLEKEKGELEVKVTDLAASIKDREQEVTDLDAVVTSVVHKLEASAAGLQEKVTVYENCMSQLEKFQDEKMEEVDEKFDKLCADFSEMALYLEEKLYPHLLTTIFGRRWLLTHDMELAIAKCLNSTEYICTLGAAIGKAIEKGMQEGLSAGITHGAGGRTLTEVFAYNPSAEADYLSALQRLQSVNFLLITELKANKDASVEMIMNLLCLEDALAKKLGLVESQPHVDQLMVPIHHSPDQRVVGSSALSLSLDVSSSRIRMIRENIANHVSALRGVFVLLSKPLSAMAFEGMEGTFGAAPDTTTALSVTFVFASTILPISTDDYEIAHMEGEEGVGADVLLNPMNLY